MADTRKKVTIDPPHLNIDEIREVGAFYYEDEPDVIYVECEPLEAYTGPCPKCGCYGKLVHGGAGIPRYIHDISMGVKSIDLILSSKRYKCKECEAVFRHPYQFVAERAQITKRLEEYIAKRALEGQFKATAEEFGISIPTVSAILEEYGEALDATRVLVAPRVLGMDETHIGHKMRGVFTDIEKGTLIEMTEDRKKATMARAIVSMKDYDKNIKIVCMDMSTGYKSVVEEWLADAIIVIDKFHVVAYIYRATESARKAIYAELKDKVSVMPAGKDKDLKEALLRAMGKDAYLFKFSTDKLKLDPKRLSLMAQLCMEFPELNKLRLVKERAEAIYGDSKTKAEAEENFKKLLDNIPEDDAYDKFREFAKMFSRWKKEILNYFVYASSYTNAATEGLNALIKQINGVGRGYSFKNLRTKALYISAARRPPVLRARKRPETSFRNMMPYDGFDFPDDPLRPQYESGDQSDIYMLLQLFDRCFD